MNDTLAFVVLGEDPQSRIYVGDQRPFNSSTVLRKLLSAAFLSYVPVTPALLMCCKAAFALLQQ